MGCREVSVSEVTEIIGGGTPKTKVKSYWNGDIPWLSVVDFNNDFRHVHFTEKTITEDGLRNSSTKLLNSGDLIISARGTVGALAQLSIPMAFNQSCYGLRANENTTNDFLYYALKNIIEKIKANTHGSVFDTITRNTFDNLIVNLPPIPEQKSIAATLTCLDDKIELNNRINKNLEEMAQAIFKSWFVDFEPFQDGEFEDSELGMIPKGWEAVELGDIATFIKGKKPRILEIKPHDTALKAYLTIDVLNGGEPQYADSEKMVLAEKHDILMVMDGASSGTVYYGLDGIVASTLAKYKVEKEELVEIVYQYLKFYEGEIKSHNTGSAIPHTDKGYVSRCKVLIPDYKSKNAVTEMLREIRILVLENKLQNQKLIETRDTLLPKLMSGEIQVPIEEVE